MQVETIYFQCARALVRSDLWNPARHIDPRNLPSAGQILAALTRESAEVSGIQHIMDVDRAEVEHILNGVRG